MLAAQSGSNRRELADVVVRVHVMRVDGPFEPVERPELRMVGHEPEAASLVGVAQHVEDGGHAVDIAAAQVAERVVRGAAHAAGPNARRWWHERLAGR